MRHFAMLTLRLVPSRVVNACAYHPSRLGSNRARVPNRAECKIHNVLTEYLEMGKKINREFFFSLKTLHYS